MQCPFISRRPITSSAARRACGKLACFATSRETASAVALACVPRESRLSVGDRSWNVATRPCTEGERPLAGAVPCYRSWTLQYPHRLPFAVLVRSSFGRRRGEKHAARWPTSQTRGPRCAARAPRSVGRFSMVRYACGTRATGFERISQDLSNSLPSTGRSIGAVAPRSAAWGGARRALARTTTTPSLRCAVRAPRSVGCYSMV